MKKTLLIFILNIFLISKSFALIEIDITRGNLDPLPIAVSPLHVDIKSETYEGIKIKELGEDISKIIENNFRGTGLFNPCLLYTSDAADDSLRVDLGGRRIIKKR